MMSEETPTTTQPVKSGGSKNQDAESVTFKCKYKKTFWQRFRASFHQCGEDLTNCLNFWCCENECFNFCCNYNNDIDDDNEEVAFTKTTEVVGQSMIIIGNRSQQEIENTDNKVVNNTQSKNLHQRGSGDFETIVQPLIDTSSLEENKKNHDGVINNEQRESKVHQEDTCLANSGSHSKWGQDRGMDIIAEDTCLANSGSHSKWGQDRGTVILVEDKSLADSGSHNKWGQHRGMDIIAEDKCLADSGSHSKWGQHHEKNILAEGRFLADSGSHDNGDQHHAGNNSESHDSAYHSTQDHSSYSEGYCGGGDSVGDYSGGGDTGGCDGGCD